MKIGVYISYCLIFILLILSFCNISMYVLLIPCTLISLFFLNILNGKILLDKIFNNPESCKFEFCGYMVYLIDKKLMGNHNVATVGYKNPIIFIEKEVNDVLRKENINALIMHEIGHINQKNRPIILALKYIGLSFTCLGLHNSIYGENMILNIICVIGIMILIAVKLLEKENEYEADRYVLTHGAKKDDLIEALLNISKLNGNKQLNMTHPALKNRIEKIESFN